MQFTKRTEILTLISKIEKIRNPLCYGKRQEEPVLIQVIKDFNSLKEIFEEVTHYEL